MSTLSPSKLLDRIRFTVGQRLSPELLNAVSDQSALRLSLFTNLFVGTAGIIEGFEKGLRVSVPKETPMILSVEPGAAINQNGQILILDETALFNLKEITVQEDTLLIIELISHEVLNQSQEIPLVKSVCRLQATQTLSPQGVEIARVRLSVKTQSLELISKSSTLETPLGKVDDRFVRRLRIQFKEMLGFEEHFYICKSLQEFHACILQIESVYSEISRMAELKQQSLFLRALLSDSNFSKPTVSFLIEEFCHTLMDVLESVRDSMDTSDPGNTSFWSTLFDLGRNLKENSSQYNIATFRTLTSIVQVLREKLLKTSIEKERVTMIREGLHALRDNAFSSHSDHALGGTLFKLKNHWDHLSLKDKTKTEVQFDTQKTLTSQFGDGTPFRGSGRFYSEGKIIVPFETKDLKGDGVILLQIYKRRGVKEFNLNVNGNTFHKENLGSSDSVDKIINVGAFVPYEFLKNGANELVIDIRRVDFDFGLMGLWYYQSDEPAGKGVSTE